MITWIYFMLLCYVYVFTKFFWSNNQTHVKATWFVKFKLMKPRIIWQIFVSTNYEDKNDARLWIEYYILMLHKPFFQLNINKNSIYSYAIINLPYNYRPHSNRNSFCLLILIIKNICILNLQMPNMIYLLRRNMWRYGVF